MPMLSGSWMKPLLDDQLSGPHWSDLHYIQKAVATANSLADTTKINSCVFISNWISLTKCNLTPVIWAGVFVDMYFAFSKLLQWRTRRTMFRFKQFSKQKQEHNFTWLSLNRELKLWVKLINHNWVLCSFCQAHWERLLCLKVDP